MRGEMNTMEPCPDCQIGYHAPFERFRRVAVIPQGPVFLNRCDVCGSLWQETLRDARRLTQAEAAAQFSSYVAQDI
jgi:hypothetical protein